MNYPDSLLDEIRARVRVSEVVSAAGHKLIKAGAEFKALSPFNVEKTPSFTINDGKCFFHDFSSGKHGDVFGFLMETRGLSFTDAVKEIAAMGGIALPGEEPKPNGSHHPRANGHDLGAAVTPRATQYERKKEAKHALRKVVATYDYCGRDGELRYQVVRYEPKTFSQRIPAPNHPGCWIWSIHKGDFVRRNGQGDWFKENDERTAESGWGERITIKDDTPHGLYNFPEVLEEMALPAADHRTIVIPEGERDCQTLMSWGILCTTNSGGAANWRSDHAAYFAGAEVVVLTDNDKAGRERGEKIAKSLTEAKARPKVLWWPDFWPAAPDKADVTDWRDKAGGTAERLYEIIDRLKVWAPPQFVSKFGFLPFERLDDPGPEHEYIVDGILSMGDKSIIGGPSMSGKSFLAIHMAFSIALGRDFFGHKVHTAGLVVIQCGEGARGIKKRLRAYRQYFGVGAVERVPLVILQSKVDLWRPDGDTKALVDELQAISAHYGMPIVAFFVDTLATATAGADENSGRDMGSVMSNIDTIQQSLKTHVCLVHHLNAAGTKLRGHTSILANIDQAIMVTSDEETKIKTASLGKQKDDETDIVIKFELMRVNTGRFRSDDKPETSCVCLRVGEKEQAAKAAAAKGFALRAPEEPIFSAVLTALKSRGDIARDEQIEAGVPAGTICVHFRDWREAYLAARAPDDTGSQTNEAIRKVWERKAGGLMKYKVLGYSNGWIWRLPKAIRGYPETADNLRTEVGQPGQFQDSDEVMEF